MDRKQVVLGFLLGFVAPILSIIIFSLVLADGDLQRGFQIIKLRDQLSTVLRIGVLGNLAFFTIAIMKHRDLVARGLVISTLLTLIYTLLI